MNDTGLSKNEAENMGNNTWVIDL